MLNIWSIGPFPSYPLWTSTCQTLCLSATIAAKHAGQSNTDSPSFKFTHFGTTSPHCHLLLQSDCFERLASCTNSGTCLRLLRFAFNYFLPLADFDKVACERMQGLCFHRFVSKLLCCWLISLPHTHTSKCMQSKAAWGSGGQQCWWLVGLFGTGLARTLQPRAPFGVRQGAKLCALNLTV